MSNHNENFIIGAVLGGLVGAAAVLLLTPISGAKAREKIVNKITPSNHPERPKKRAQKAHLEKKK